MSEYSGKSVLITGASSGIGAALARRYSRAGANLVLTARREDRLTALAAELRGKQKTAIGIAADVGQDGEMERVVARAREEFGRLDVVIANAGFSVAGRFDELTLADYRRQFEVNVFGVLRTIYASLSELKKTRGRIVLIGSALGAVSMPENTAYCMSKFSLTGLSDALGSELASDGVSSTLIMPGFVDTDIFSVSNKNEAAKTGKDRPPRYLLMPADQAADQVYRAAHSRRRRKVITLHAKAAVLFSRMSPDLLAAILRRAR